MTSGRLPVLRILREVPSVYRRHWKLLIPLALLVLLPQAIADAGFDEVDSENLTGGQAAVALGGIAATTLINLLGEAVYAGAITVAVLAWRTGAPLPGVRGFLRELPLGRLVVVDLLYAFGTALGIILLIVPGLVFMTFFFISPVVIEVERSPVIQSMRRSARLVRGNFWRALALVLLVVVGVSLATELLGLAFHSFVSESAVNLVADALLQPIEGLVTVLAGLYLLKAHGSPHLDAIERDGLRAMAPAPAK